MNYNDIEKYFSVNVIKKTFTELSLDKVSNSSLILSEKESYDFDFLNNQIKTSDTVIFDSKKIIFVEFKKGKINKEKNLKTKKIREPDIRLKLIESPIVFINYILKNKITDSVCFPNDYFHFYLVYDRTRSDASQLIHFSALERKFQTQYSNFFSKIKIISQDRFIKLFRL
ncbi:hypothetical protein LNJ08_08285 [Tenacibaculum finnmarkense genomovar ulcerans]|uniref:hypothetical protein n=1 Tax=Tenacibaculum finnmarkense TaxID=2781243 RepID=UPI001E3134C3|nr:hypothetical protein [Tenacibaculum finnmarkense]MCD8454395.1 hypothetical protein [Tenacibaculum finnmarkense genomovar ulcerans]